MEELIKDLLMGQIEQFLGDVIQHREEAARQHECINRIDKAIADFCIKHDGSIITSKEFYIYLKYQNPIDAMRKHLKGEDDLHISKKEFIQHLASDFINDAHTKGVIIPLEEQNLPVRLFTQIFDILFSALPDDEKKFYLQLNEPRIQSRIQEKVCRAGQEKIASMLLELKRPLDKEEEIRIYLTLRTEFLQGNIVLIDSLQPLLQKKTPSILYAYELTVSALREELHEIRLLQLARQIENDIIFKDCCRFLFAYGLLTPDLIRAICDLLPPSNLQILGSKAATNDIAGLFELHQQEGNNFNKIVMSSGLDDERWLLVRLIYRHLNNSHKIQLIAPDFFPNPITFLDIPVLFSNQLSQEINFHTSNIRNCAEQLEQKLKPLIPIFQTLKYACAVPFFKALFFAHLSLTHAQEIQLEFSTLSQALKYDPHLMIYNESAKLLSGESVSEQRLVLLCEDCKTYFPLEIYFNFLKEDVDRQAFLERNEPFVLKDPNLLVAYINLLEKHNKSTKICEFLTRNKDAGACFLAYQISSFKYLDTPTFEEIVDKYKSNQLAARVDDLLVLGEMFAERNLIKEVEKIYETLTKSNTNSPILLMLEAFVLLQKGSRLQALELMLDHFDQLSNEANAVYWIFLVCRESQREVPSNVVDAAQKFEVPLIQEQLAFWFHQKGQNEAALEQMTRAILYTDPLLGKSKDVFANYIILHLQIRHNSEVPKVSRIEPNSMVILKENDSGNEIRLCIHKKNLYPKQKIYYQWGGAFHITYEQAIELSILGKTLEQHISLDNKCYTVVHLAALEQFLFHKCLEYSEGSDLIHTFHIPEKANGQLDISQFVEMIRPYFNTNTHIEEMLEHYRDTSHCPATLNLIRSFASTLTNQQVMLEFMNDSSIAVRSSVFPRNTASNPIYILSLTALIVLSECGIREADLDGKSVIIPASLKNLIQKEAQTVYENYFESTTGPLHMTLEEGQAVLHRYSPESCENIVQKSIRLKRLTEVLHTEEIFMDLKFNLLSTAEVKQLFGICDHDAIALAIKMHGQLVAFEPMFKALQIIQSLPCEIIAIPDFLCKLALPVNKIIEAMRVLAVARFEEFLSPECLQYISNYCDSLPEGEEKEELLIIWTDFLQEVRQLRYPEVSRHLYSVLRICLQKLFQNTPNPSSESLEDHPILLWMVVFSDTFHPPTLQ